MNEVLFLIIILIALCLVLVALKLGTHFLIGLIATYLLIANLFASKLSIIFGVNSSLAIPLYAAIFLATDTLAEHYGKRIAFKAVWMGFMAQVCMVTFGQLMIRGEPTGDPIVSDALDVIFGFIPRIVLGSFIAYLISQNFDIVFYDYLKEKFQGRRLWMRNIFSTTISQAIDTVIFVLIAFYGKFPGLAGFILSVWVVKVLIALIDTPFIYLTYRVLGKEFGAKTTELESQST